MYVYIHAFTCMKEQNLWDLQTCIFFSLENFFSVENNHCKNPKYFVYPKSRWNFLKIRIVSLWMYLYDAVRMANSVETPSGAVCSNTYH